MAADPKLYRQYHAMLKRGTPPDPQGDKDACGFWRIQAAKTKEDYPVAIYPNAEGRILVKVGRQAPCVEGSTDYWEFFGGSWTKVKAVARADYDHALQQGFWLDDGKAARKQTVEEAAGVKPGANDPPVEELIEDQIKNLAESIKAAADPDDEDQAITLSSKLDRLAKLMAIAEAKRVEEKAPHLEAERAVEAKWRTIREPGVQAEVVGKAKRSRYLTKKQAKLDEEARIETARLKKVTDAENERRRILNENAVAEAEAVGQATETIELHQEIEAPVVAPERARVSSTFGRATSNRKVRTAVIEDIKVLTEYFIHSGDATFREYLQGRAQAAVRSKITLPGVIVKET